MIDRQNTPWTPCSKPSISWQAATPRSERFQDIYYAPAAGLAETDYVFLQGNTVSDRFEQLAHDSRIVIAETGFGTGLNFLSTLLCWCSQRRADTQLHYIGIDAYPLSRADLQRALADFPQLANHASALLTQWPSNLRGVHRCRWSELGVTLDLWWEDAGDALDDLASFGRQWVDIWYLDGFTPSRNQDMWTQRVYSAMAQLSRRGASVATFTAASDVRRGLTAAGFIMTKRPGFAHKRECLRGVFEGKSVSVQATISNWDLTAPRIAPNEAVVVGAGLAGAFAARALAERGCRVTVLEAGAIASGGSGNNQGLTYTRLSRKHAPLGDFGLCGFEYSTRLYRRLSAVGALGPSAGEHCGFVQLSSDQKTLDYLRAVVDGDCIGRVVSAPEAADLCGLPLTEGGFYYPAAYWLNPPELCRLQLDHHNIQSHEQVGDVRLERTASGWHLHCNGGLSLRSSTVVLATALSTQRFEQLQWLSLQGIRGQVTELPVTVTTLKQKAALCHEGYLPPARAGFHCIGASYAPNDLGTDLRETDHQHNLNSLRRVLPDLKIDAPPGGWSGRCSLRCTSADYLPLVGPAPDLTRFNTQYAELSKQKTRVIAAPCPTLDGLWLLSALGSRGLTAAPLAAELLASELYDEPPPMTRLLRRALAPARFPARGLIRGAPL